MLVSEQLGKLSGSQISKVSNSIQDCWHMTSGFAAYVAVSGCIVSDTRVTQLVWHHTMMEDMVLLCGIVLLLLLRLIATLWWLLLLCVQCGCYDDLQC